MNTEGTSLLVLTIFAFWISSMWDPDGREVVSN